MERRIRFTRSARKHRIGVARVRAAMENAGEPEIVPAVSPETDDRLFWIGMDDRGVELEVVGLIRADGTLLIIHAMPTFYRRPRGP